MVPIVSFLKNRRSVLKAAGLTAASLSAPGLLRAQSWPARPIKLVVPFPPGGTSDVIGRLMAVELTRTLGQNVVVENRPGAGTVIGVDFVAKSPPDGYTLGIIANSFCANQTLVKNLPYDGLRELRPAGLMAQSDHVLASHSGSGLKNLADLLAQAKKQPGKLSYASFGNGTSAHLAGALLCTQAGIDLIHVPYKGQAPAMNDLIGGQVTVMFGNWPEFRQHVRSGKLVSLGMATATRSPIASDLPTLAEQGLALESNSWFGIVVRSGVPDEVVQRLNQDINQALQSAAFKPALDEGGMASLAGTPERFGEFIKSEISKYAQVIRQAKITIE